ncbi:protein phosphatase CheZ [Herbaspirillum sp. LeCh32-8]|uniref:protein phosphatase CheZ n=1 Tax=Herbaspirillum sp. LeCh32-8 TaxID=2821356 RepID=UPI001AE44165|nr:protein phosphatase CheZ [Herbaspirillum sp. LeCh32-8]MBP0596634.1 protein phosphatase CheZ [Herbaspirillum sp. LeCh32-8]
MSDDVDLEALFDEISAQTLPAMTPGADAPAGQEQPADEGDQSDKPMYERLGGIVRLLHDSMRELGYDRSLTDVATQIGDAQNRLEHVATLTEQAANKVLNALDSGMPAQDRLQEQAKNINDRWTKLYAGQMNIDEFKQLAGDSQKFSASVIESTDAEKARMLEIMMAQDFQDITGQLIKKIVGITATAERELAQLLRDNAPAEVRAQIEAEKPVTLLNGPAAPGTAMGQNDVDDLLDSLGF